MAVSCACFSTVAYAAPPWELAMSLLAKRPTALCTDRGP
eukprot:CAMPEP_0180315152 /NCGR_PEP_ID=MMETSP0988-20121125/32482_1 /TAXON_ID=697907 /ORGANISM="non described non described, Strain CCMP2293" /LENGTH=38 /DNA_ID= /DNA_START= /DNA_END= /DNA_ORIENTATION=